MSSKGWLIVFCMLFASHLMIAGEGFNEFGAAIGAPGGINGIYGHWFKDVPLVMRISAGTIFVLGGAQLELGVPLQKEGVLKQYLAVAGALMPPGDMVGMTYVAAIYGFNFHGFQLSLGPDHFSDNNGRTGWSVVGQIGYTFFKESKW